MRIRATVRLRNDRMLEAREKLGWSQKVTAEACGVSLDCYARLERLDFSALPSRIDVLQRSIDSVANILDLKREDICPEGSAGVKFLTRLEATREVPLDTLLTMQKTPILDSPTEHLCDQRELETALDAALSKLTPRESDVIRARYGLDDDPLICEEVAKQYNISRGRIWQVECKALRKLQHPSRSRPLEKFLPDDVVDDDEDKKSSPFDSMDRAMYDLAVKLVRFTLEELLSAFRKEQKASNWHAKHCYRNIRHTLRRYSEDEEKMGVYYRLGSSQARREDAQYFKGKDVL